jgi:hypothetical protein
MKTVIFLKSWVLPFLLALGGVISDYVTTTIGLNMNMGFYEIHPQYSPVWALLFFWGAIAILTLTLPKEKPWNLATNGLALASYIGAVNNTLVILGLFTGLVF